MSETTHSPPQDAQRDEPPKSTAGDKPSTAPAKDEFKAQRTIASRRHFRIGWWGLFAFASLGLLLESLQGLRVGWYLDVSNETRRLMFRLAHAHGTLMAVVNIVFGLSLASSRFGRAIGSPKVPSACFVAAMILIPAGFFTGGLVIYDGDPGLGVMLVPVGALLFIVGALLVARADAH